MIFFSVRKIGTKMLSFVILPTAKVQLLMFELIETVISLQQLSEYIIIYPRVKFYFKCSHTRTKRESALTHAQKETKKFKDFL